MSKTFTAALAQTPQTATAVCTTGGTVANDTPSNSVLLMTAGADGCIVSRLWAMPRDTVTATALYLFVSQDSGSTKRLKDSVLMPAATLAVTSAVTITQFTNYSEAAPLRLKAGDQLYVSIGVSLSSGIVFSVEWVDF